MLKDYRKIVCIHINTNHFGQYKRLLQDLCFCFEQVVIDLLILRQEKEIVYSFLFLRALIDQLFNMIFTQLQ